MTQIIYFRGLQAGLIERHIWVFVRLPQKHLLTLAFWAKGREKLASPAAFPAVWKPADPQSAKQKHMEEKKILITHQTMVSFRDWDNS